MPCSQTLQKSTHLVQEKFYLSIIWRFLCRGVQCMYENRSDKFILFEFGCASSSCPQLNCKHTSRCGAFPLLSCCWTKLTASLPFSPFCFRCHYLRSGEGGKEGGRKWDGLNIRNLISWAGKQRTP